MVTSPAEGRPPDQVTAISRSCLARGLLGLVDDGEDRCLGRLGVDHLAGLEALGRLIAAAQQHEALPAPGANDVAAELGAADVEQAEGRVAVRPAVVGQEPLPDHVVRRAHVRRPGVTAATG
jgi:hypothetical protein